MLVITRTPDHGADTILIGDNIKIQVVRVRGQLVSIGIEAPREIKALREEIADRPPAGDREAV